MRPMMKLFSQFEQVANATPFALREEGQISILQNLQFLRAYVLVGGWGWGRRYVSSLPEYPTRHRQDPLDGHRVSR